MIHIIYTRDSVLPIASTTGSVYLRKGHPNRVWVANDSFLRDDASGTTYSGPQFMLIQMLFFLGVRVRAPHLSLEWDDG